MMLHLLVDEAKSEVTNGRVRLLALFRALMRSGALGNGRRSIKNQYRHDTKRHECCEAVEEANEVKPRLRLTIFVCASLDQFEQPEVEIDPNSHILHVNP